MKNNTKDTFCAFCKQNGEVEEFYKAHKLKDKEGNILCPVLANYTCPSCGVTGKHTLNYCPKGKPATMLTRVREKKNRPKIVQINHSVRNNNINHQHKDINHQNQNRRPKPHFNKQHQATNVLTVRSPTNSCLDSSLNSSSMSTRTSDSSNASSTTAPAKACCNQHGFPSIPAHLNRLQKDQYLFEAKKLRPQERVDFILSKGYNPMRLEVLKQAAYIVELMLFNLSAQCQIEL